MRYFSMFSGIGGFELGIQRACSKNKEQRIQGNGDSQGQHKQRSDISTDGFSCIGFSEIDKYAKQIYKKHWEHKDYGDCTKIKWEEVEDFDMFVGGFPCQAFSIAGKRMGFYDTRGTLFFQIARALREKQPRFFLLENVKGLLSHDKGNTFLTILTTLDELGYDCQWQVLNSKNFGVPQNRERVFIIGHLRGTSRPKVFPIGESKRETKQNNERNKRTAVYYDDSIPKATTRRGRVMDDVGALMANPRGGVAISNSSEREFGFKKVSPALCARDYKEPKLVNDGMKIRRLTPTECERLQGFPDGWTEGLSDTQRYKCLGNAVTVNVIKAIMERLI